MVDFMDTYFDSLGEFDIVLYLGVLYHVEDPLRALRRLRVVTRELAVIQTHAIVVPARAGRPLGVLRSAELARDVSNWWRPSLAALTKACRAAGFRQVEVLEPAPGAPGPDIVHFVKVLHAVAASL